MIPGAEAKVYVYIYKYAHANLVHLFPTSGINRLDYLLTEQSSQCLVGLDRSIGLGRSPSTSSPNLITVLG